MGWIGREPAIGNYQVCDALTASATASYTLQVGGTNVVPESVNHMLVSLNGILQAPTTSFTVSGSTLTFASALTSSDSIDFVILLGSTLDVGIPSDASITNAKLASDVISGETDIGGAIADADLFLIDDGAGGTLRKTAASRLKTYVGGGLAVAGQWRLSAAMTNMDAGDHITGSWEEVDTGSYSRIGSAMAVSSGIWTFPETGIYYINLTGMLYDNTDQPYMGSFIQVTSNDSAYTNVSYHYNFADANSITNPYITASCQYIFDVTNTSTHKCRFAVDSANNGIVCDGASNYNKTHATFLKLGDT